MMNTEHLNPFEVKTPEALSPSDTANLFVDVFTDFHKLKEVGHTFIHGPRGTGKSMMLRYLEPDVQLAAGNVQSLKELRYYAVHVPIKKAWSDISEWKLITGGAYYVIAEHVMVTYILYKTFASLDKVADGSLFFDCDFQYKLNRLLLIAGCDEVSFQGRESFLSDVKDIFQSEFYAVKQYLKRLLFKRIEDTPYGGAIFTYLDFLVPLFALLQESGFLADGPFFLLIDDADQMDEGMQRVLNTWVSCRTTDIVCLKIATQMRYKTYRSVDGKLIECPHDYSEINISSIYTRDGSKYWSRINEIVEKRLRLIGVDVSPEDFFPEDIDQRDGISAVKDEILKSREAGVIRGNRASDDVVRYAVPVYMSRLAGSSKSSSSYSYAGFKSLVDLSSGVIRWFLDPAAKMYSETLSLSAEKLTGILSGNGKVSYIPVDIQDKVIKDWSLEFIDSEFSKLKQSVSSGCDGDNHNSQVLKLYNLITALGELFRTRLLDDNASERKVFSVLIADEVPPNLDGILSMAVDLGYLQRSSIGSKEGRGRRPKYTLSRRLAPYFKLDPSGYAYNLSVTSNALLMAISDPKSFVRERLKDHSNSNQGQQSLDI